MYHIRDRLTTLWSIDRESSKGDNMTNQIVLLWRKRVLAISMILALMLGLGIFGVVYAKQVTKPTNACQLGATQNSVQHVIYIQFDNTHFQRDNPAVPSDLEQMPHLLNFITNNGTMLTDQHTPLISHTGTDILTSLTGVYGDRHGVPVSNSFRYFNPDGTSNPGVSFAYWTAPLFDPSGKPTDTRPNMLSADGKNAPAPWVPYTRAGCNFGAVGTANTVLENTNIDIPTVFGANSSQAQEVASNSGQAFADFVGIAVHCAKQSAVCSTSNQGITDALPDEPGGYTGYQGLFGHKYVAPQISPNGPLTDLNGNVIKDSSGHIGFPGFDGMSASVSLSYVAAMQEHGVPVTYAYISDAHDNHATGRAYGPGEAGYEAQLHAYDDAFGKFFSQLAQHGITRNNTLFVFTADEGDHFVGGPPSPSNCDGVNVPCTYSKIGEVNANLAGLLATQQQVTTPFTVHSDSAPTVYITGNPQRTASVTRTFEQASSKLTALNPITGKTDTVTNYMADPVEMKLLHMVTADPARTPTFTLFANPDYFLFAGAPNCNTQCVTEPPAFAWNHGDVASDIDTTWLGLVGPGIRHLGVDHNVWSDHTDTRPTMLALLGMHDDYAHQGRALIEVMDDKVLPPAIRSHRDAFLALARTYKQINAPVGALGLATLRASTKALASSSPNDGTYTAIENTLAQLTTARDSLENQMESQLEAATFGGHSNAATVSNSLIQQADSLLDHALHF
jgi:hypothetical protein